MANFFELFEGYCRSYGYSILFAGVMLENAGIPVPGETAVIVSGFLASAAGGHIFDLWAVMGVAIAAAVVGDNIGFWLGRRWARPRLERGRRFLFLNAKALRMAEGYFDRFGGWTIFFPLHHGAARGGGAGGRHGGHAVAALSDRQRFRGGALGRDL